MTFQNQNQFPPNNFDEKQRIDEEIKQADVALQSKNVSIEAINEHLKLSEELDKHGLSTNDIDKLLKLLVNAKKYGFDGKEIAEKLYSIQELEWKEKELKDKCKRLSKRISSYKVIVPFTESIVALGVGIEELIALDVGIKEAAKLYNLSFFNSTLRLIDDIKRYNKTNGLKRELWALSLQKYTINEACSRHSQALRALLNLQIQGITEDRLLYLNNLLENNGYNIDDIISNISKHTKSLTEHTS